jgi:hypothetical protein
LGTLSTTVAALSIPWRISFAGLDTALQRYPSEPRIRR